MTDTSRSIKVSAYAYLTLEQLSGDRGVSLTRLIDEIVRQYLIAYRDGFSAGVGSTIQSFDRQIKAKEKTP